MSIELFITFVYQNIYLDFYTLFTFMFFFCMSNTKTKPIRVINASKRSANAEHLVNNLDCASNYNLKRFKIIKNCFNISDLVKLEAICILSRKPKLCKHKDFDYTVSLFS